MKLRDYRAQLDKLVAANPKALDADVVTAADDEGNYFSHVRYAPTLGHFEDGEFQELAADEEPNAVCVN